MTNAQRRKYFALKTRMAKLLAEHVSFNNLDFMHKFMSSDFWDHCVDVARDDVNPIQLPQIYHNLPSLDR